MCTVKIETVVGVDSNGDNERDAVIIVGTVEDCSGLQVAVFGSQPPADADISDGEVSKPATILAPGVSAHGVSPTGNERVFTVTFTLDDTTSIKGRCGSVKQLGLLTVCDDDDKCRDAIVWDKPIDCVQAECPQITITPDVHDDCVNQTRSVGLSLAANPFSAGLSADVDFGDGTSETVDFSVVPGTNIGIAPAVHNYSAPATGTVTFHVTVTIAGRPDCVTTAEVDVGACPAAPPGPGQGQPCPVDQIRLRVTNSNNTDVTAQIEDGACLPPGRYRVRAQIVPAGATTAFAWRVDGIAAAVGQRGVVAIAGAQLTIDLTTAFRSVSVIAAGCASDGVDLRPCEKVCCPDLTGLTASCMPRCPPSTTATLTATGTDIECAEAFDWDFGDGTAIVETTVATATHTYPSLNRFHAAVTIVRPRECGRPRIQRRTVTVGPCPPSCFCAFLAIASGLLFLAFLTLMPLIACASDPATRQALIITLIVVVILLAIAWLWWFIDPCCRPTRCELSRILFWVFSWALLILGIIAIFCTLAIPFGVAYLLAQQFFLRMINSGGCGAAPDIFSWPFPGCR
jgi:hypothetical protein